jgi:hypothetical protein
MERRLAAVLIADVVGYVRLSQADEEERAPAFRPISTRSSSRQSARITAAL